MECLKGREVPGLLMQQTDYMVPKQDHKKRIILGSNFLEGARSGEFIPFFSSFSVGAFFTWVFCREGLLRRTPLHFPGKTAAEQAEAGGALLGFRDRAVDKKRRLEGGSAGVNSV